MRMAIEENTPEDNNKNQITLKIDQNNQEKEVKEEEKTLLEYWHDNYWMVNFSPSYTIQQTDEAVNKLIDTILTMGEEQITGKVKNKHAKDAILMR